jgi:hypothetical protein
MSDAAVTENVELMRFTLEAEHQDIDVNSLLFTMGSDGIEADDTFSEIWLADDSGNRIASASTIATTTTFSTTDLNDLSQMVISEGSTRTYRLMATVKDQDGATPNITAGTSASSTLTASDTNIVAEDSLFNDATVTSSTVAGNDIHLYLVVVNHSNLSASSSGVENVDHLASVEFSFTLTANGGDAFISKTTSTLLATSSTASTANLTAISAGSANAGDTSSVFKINSGSSRTFTVTGSMDNENGTAGSKELKITGIKWGSVEGSPAANTNDFGLEALQVVRTLAG